MRSKLLAMSSKMFSKSQGLRKLPFLTDQMETHRFRSRAKKTFSILSQSRQNSMRLTFLRIHLPKAILISYRTEVPLSLHPRVKIAEASMC
jgi:hypothetical protein